MDITVRGEIRNTTRTLLHIASELSSLFISTTCLQELGIISDSFPLPEKTVESVDAVDEQHEEICTQGAWCICTKCEEKCGNLENMIDSLSITGNTQIQHKADDNFSPTANSS